MEVCGMNLTCLEWSAKVGLVNMSVNIKGHKRWLVTMKIKGQQTVVQFSYQQFPPLPQNITT